MTPLETYLKAVREIRSSGEAVPETSYYGAFETLVNEIGETLSPKVRCIINIKNRGAGIPDGGFFAADQLTKSLTDHSQPDWGGQVPARGVLELKNAKEDVEKIVELPQVMDYLDKYGQVLVSNFRQFLLVGRDSAGNAEKREAYNLAESDASFFEAMVHPQRTKSIHEKRLGEYLKRVMLSAAELRLPENLAWLLASYARDALERIHDADISDLKDISEKLQAFLGISFGGEQGEHFFRSTLIQTIFYGVFAAWVLWSREKQAARVSMPDRFDWRLSAFQLRVPVLKKLFELIATSSNLEALNLIQILNWAGDVLNRVNRNDFFQNFEEEHAVQYFYEPFLEAFDPVLRKDMGVWYTPREIVAYMVERVDRVLREELDEPDGLASDRVYVLDPCCGTGAYLVEVLRRIEKTIKERGEDALTGEEIKNAAMNRIIGLEILPASFVISHMEVSLFVQTAAGSSFSNDERPAIYLTNALTGWEAAKIPNQIAMDKMFKMEWEAATSVKRDRPILVILGNPPYNGFAGVSLDEEGGLVERYKLGLIDQWGIKKFNMDDLYVRFFRLAERRIAEMTGCGVVCYISNFSYLKEPSFVVMRKSLLNSFDKLWLDCMNGDSRQTGKLTPEGNSDPSVFSTKHNKAGIRVGTSIALMVRKRNREKTRTILLRNFWGVEKKKELFKSLEVTDFDCEYRRCDPREENRFSFWPGEVCKDYYSWPKVTELCALPPCHGPVEMRGNSMIAFKSDKSRLSILEAYLNPNKSDEEIATLEPRFMKSSGEFNALTTRASLKGKVAYNEQKITPYQFKPYDVRVAYLDSSIQPLFSRPSPDLLLIGKIPGNGFFITRDTADKTEEGVPFNFSKFVSDYDSISGHARHLPVLVPVFKFSQGKGGALGDLYKDIPTKANLSIEARNYLEKLGVSNPDTSHIKASMLWMHCLAIGYSPQYLSENSYGIKHGWPRFVLPKSVKLLTESATWGFQVAELLDTEHPTKSINTGSIRPGLKMIAIVSHAEKRQIDASGGELEVTAGWGYIGNQLATMPGQGKVVQREYEPKERLSMEKEAAEIGLSYDEVVRLLGQTTFDVYLNDKVFWKNIPSNVWLYRIGGYQVIKKWLSYRDMRVLGRSLTIQEVREVTNIARRLAAIILLQPQLDENYRRIKESVFEWKRT